MHTVVKSLSIVITVPTIRISSQIFNLKTAVERSNNISTIDDTTSKAASSHIRHDNIISLRRVFMYYSYVVFLVAKSDETTQH